MRIKITKLREAVWQPFTLGITFETKDELLNFLDVVNDITSMKQIATALQKEIQEQERRNEERERECL